MNILHVVNIYFVIPYFLGDQLTYFSQRHCNMHIICSPSEELGIFAKQMDIAVKEVPILRKISIFKDIRAVCSIYRYIRNNRIDIVNGHTPKGALLSMFAAFIAKTPKRIYFRHGLVYETTTGLQRFILKNMDRLTSLLSTQIVCVSPSVAKKSLEDHLNLPSKQLVLSKGTCNGINLSRFNRHNLDNNYMQELRRQYALSSNDLVIGFTGRLVRDKGIIELVSAFQSLKKEYANLRLLLVGMFEERDALPKTISDEIRINSAIIYTGYISNKEIPFFYALMDIFVLLSYREGFPTSIVEASAMELPVITTQATGCIDAIIENHTGFFVNHHLPEIKEKLQSLIDDKELSKKMGKQGRKFIEENFEEKIIWEKIEQLYKQ